MSNEETTLQSDSFGRRVVVFYEDLVLPAHLPEDVLPINPLAEEEVQKVFKAFFEQFFNDTRKRVFLIGINPGRFGSGVTGIPFTDPVALREYCNIHTTLPPRKELSSQFMYRCIERWGGAEKFYADFFPTAVSPIGFIKNGVNFNYYDSQMFFASVRPFLLSTLRKQYDFGARNKAIILGSGKNLACMRELNDELRLFDALIPLEHPRFIMQYKRKDAEEYVQKYIDTFNLALA